jgi:hypothetical protein
VQRHLMLRIEAEELVVRRMFGRLRHGEVTSYLPAPGFICRRKFSKGENNRLMPLSKARVDPAQTHRFPECLIHSSEAYGRSRFTRKPQMSFAASSAGWSGNLTKQLAPASWASFWKPSAHRGLWVS